MSGCSSSVSRKDATGSKNEVISEFWTDPPPPLRRPFHCSFSGRKVRRRSRRLVSKRLCYSPSIPKVGSTDQCSDYGTGSEYSYVFTNNSQDVEQPCFTTKNPFAVEGADLYQDVYNDHTLSPGYVKDDDLNHHLSDLSLQEYDFVEEAEKPFLDISKLSYREMRVKVLSKEGICVLIPLAGYKLPDTTPFIGPTHPFSISMTDLEVESVLLSNGLRVCQTCPVMKLEPMGTEFCELGPAIAIINLSIVASEEDEIICLHTDDPAKSSWQILPDSAINKDRTKLILKTYRLNYITVVIRQKFQQVTKHIRCRAGGQLRYPDLNVSVDFPKGSINEDIEVSVKVCFDREFDSMRFFDTLNEESVSDYVKYVASPTICIEPHGLTFGQPVNITIPIPDYDKIMKISHGTARLNILHSNTRSETEKLDWQFLETPFELRRMKLGAGPTMTYATFSVPHFSFFRAVWDRISNSLYQARVGMYYFFVSIAMRVQAFCEEFENDRFGLEVICFQSDKKFPQNQTYKFLVGQSQKKLVRSGQLLIRLKSMCFVADLEAGEEEDLVKEEDFRGWDFEKQFACKFKENMKIERGPFGKVIVSRKASGYKETLFEFNIQKYGIENEKTPTGPVQDKWVELPIAELAGSLFITDGDNWKKLATHIGFTKTEIKNYFKGAADPFMAIKDKYIQRGGTAEEFVNALYSVHRELKINNMSSPSSSKKSSNNSSGRGSMTRGKYNAGFGHESDTSGTRTSQYSQDSLLSSTRKRSNNSTQGGAEPKHKRRKVNVKEKDPTSDADGETSESESENTKSKTGSDANSVQFRNDQTKLNNTFLWNLSADLDTLTWRALGRSLGLDESTLIKIEHAHKSQGFREMSYQVLNHWKEKYPKRCTFGNLYSALCKENMYSAAKKMIQIKNNDSE